MNQTFTADEAIAPRALQVLRCVRLIVHLLWGTVIVASVYPFTRTSMRTRLKRRWSRQLLRMLGIRLDVYWDDVQAGSLVVANHVSWLDIYALNATHSMAFVAKADVRGWPLVGWLAARTDTVFLRRGLRADARNANTRIAHLLEDGQNVAVFPEGTTTDGSTVLEFHAALLQSAIAVGRPIQPVAITYHDRHGGRSCAPVYSGDTSFHECLLAILACRGLAITVRAAEPLPTNATHRRVLALAARQAVSTQMALSRHPPPSAPYRLPTGTSSDAHIAAT